MPHNNDEKDDDDLGEDDDDDLCEDDDDDLSEMIMILSSKAPSPPDSLGLAADINGGVTTSGKKRGRISLREPFKNL